jgi:Glycosyltransferase (GlcNAc)
MICFIANEHKISYSRRRSIEEPIVSSTPLIPPSQSSEEWRYVRSPQHSIINPLLAITEPPIPVLKHEKSDSPVKSHIIDASQLQWPPVGLNGSIPSNEGYDIMPLTGLKVPRFWVAPDGVDINKIGTKVNNFETIFLMIASYRDFQCRETIISAFSRCDHPERLFVGAVDQFVPGDIGCAQVDTPCHIDPNQVLCKYRNQISIFKMDAKYSTGPVAARHIGDRMYRGQYFVMQMDAHCHFVRHWDTLLIAQWSSTKNEMAVLRYQII